MDLFFDHYSFCFISDGCFISTNGLNSNTKLFQDDNSLFSVAQNINLAENNLNSYLMKISEWAFQWKMKLNRDLKKQS